MLSQKQKIFWVFAQSGPIADVNLHSIKLSHASNNPSPNLSPTIFPKKNGGTTGSEVISIFSFLA